MSTLELVNGVHMKRLLRSTCYGHFFFTKITPAHKNKDFLKTFKDTRYNRKKQLKENSNVLKKYEYRSFQSLLIKTSNSWRY